MKNELNYSIRPFKIDDQEEVIALWKLCRLTRPWNNPVKDIERKLDIQSDMFLVIEVDKHIIGSVMAAYDGHRGMINYLAVHPLYQKKGFGKIIMSYVEQKLLEKGCPKINLLVRADNLTVKEFYKNIDYIEQEDIKVFGKRLISD